MNYAGNHRYTSCKSYETSHYTVKAVNHANLSVESGEAVAIVGPSGSGKSTLLNIIGLILKPDSGSVAVDGKEVLNMSDRRCSTFRNASFGYIVQDFALLDDETVYHNIRIPLLYNRQIKRREHKPRIREIAQKLDISDKLNRKAGKLSGGERQRVAIARAIVCDQPIICGRTHRLTGRGEQSECHGHPHAALQGKRQDADHRYARPFDCRTL